MDISGVMAWGFLILFSFWICKRPVHKKRVQQIPSQIVPVNYVVVKPVFGTSIIRFIMTIAFLGCVLYILIVLGFIGWIGIGSPGL